MWPFKKVPPEAKVTLSACHIQSAWKKDGTAFILRMDGCPQGKEGRFISLFLVKEYVLKLMRKEAERSNIDMESVGVQVIGEETDPPGPLDAFLK